LGLRFNPESQVPLGWSFRPYKEDYDQNSEVLSPPLLRDPQKNRKAYSSQPSGNYNLGLRSSHMWRVIDHLVLHIVNSYTLRTLYNFLVLSTNTQTIWKNNKETNYE
jgi:hypothetical protein